MKTKKRLFPVLVCLVLVVAALAAMTVASIADNANHASISVDKQTVYVGDTVTVTFKAGQDKNVTTLTGGIRFDSEYLECTGVTLAQANGHALLSEVELDPDSNNENFRMVVLSTVAEANATEQVGFSSVGTNDVSYKAADLFVATFKVLKTGNTDVVAYESSYKGGNFKDLQTITITATERAADVEVVAKGNISYTVSGQVVTVTHDTACKVGYWDATASKYVAIAAVKVSDNTYSFTAPAGVTEVLLVAKGDVTGDGKCNLLDRAKIAKHTLKSTHGKYEALSEAWMLFAADVDNNGTVNLLDRAKIAKHTLKNTHIKYEALSW